MGPERYLFARVSQWKTDPHNKPGKPEKGDEIDEQASKHGINYYEVTQAAARGDKKALKTFFGFGGDVEFRRRQDLDFA